MEHIFKNHMLPTASEKAFFLSRSQDQVLNTIAQPDVVEPHWWCADKVLYKKHFANTIGRHGASGLDTNHIYVVVRKSNNHIITAYPLYRSDTCLCVDVYLYVCR